MNIRRGIKLLAEKIGYGQDAELGDYLIYNLRAYLNHGDEIPINNLRESVHGKFKQHSNGKFTIVEGYKFINFSMFFDLHNTVKSVAYSLYGMREGGYRKVKVSPHLAFGIKGIPGVVPPQATVIFEIWLRNVQKKETESVFRDTVRTLQHLKCLTDKDVAGA